MSHIHLIFCALNLRYRSSKIEWKETREMCIAAGVNIVNNTTGSKASSHRHRQSPSWFAGAQEAPRPPPAGVYDMFAARFAAHFVQAQGGTNIQAFPDRENVGERARVIRGASVSKFSFRNSSCRCIDFRNSNFYFFVLYFRNSNGESSDFRFSTFEI